MTNPRNQPKEEREETMENRSGDTPPTECCDIKEEWTCSGCGKDLREVGLVDRICGVWEVTECANCGEAIQIGRAPGTLPSMFVGSGQVRISPYSLEEQLEWLEQEPELRKPVDLSAPAWDDVRDLIKKKSLEEIPFKKKSLEEIPF